jgi:integral membrane protein
MLKTNLGRLRMIGFLEGISFLALLGIAMPLKYLNDQPNPVRVIGMAHGVLFMLYVVWVYIVREEEKWSLKDTFIALVASIIPFGTFYADAKLFRKKS